MQLEEFTAALQPLLPVTPKQIAVAVSGGADSFALLHVTSLWAQRHGVVLSALTVNHGLRDDSAAEAATIAAWCSARKIPHETLPWQGDKPTTGLQAVARQMRRHLLCRACQNHGVDTLLLGHQADDQAETMVMRLQRGTGLGGLEAMQPLTRDTATGVALIRPLLHMTRADLRHYCVGHQLPFFDDPSNENTAYERVRVRQTLGTMPQLAEGVAKTALRLRRANDTLNQIAQGWFDAHAQSTQESRLWLPAEWRTELLPEIQLRVLHITITALKRQRLSVTKLEKLAQSLNDTAFTGVTIAGCWIRPKVLGKQAGFLFSLEPQRRL